MSKKIVCHSGGCDSLACMLGAIEEYDAENIISLGFDYGQRHFEMENAAARRFCKKHNITRFIMHVPLDQIGGCALTDRNISVTTDMNNQRSTVVPQRNAILLLFAAAYAEVNDCDTIIHGAVKEDEAAYRDCRYAFFNYLTMTIQAGRKQPIKGSEDILNDISVHGDLLPSRIDIIIRTPLIDEKKEETLKRIVDKYGIEVYNDTYTCYNGAELSCGKCPSCIERLESFKANNLVDPIPYENK